MRLFLLAAGFLISNAFAMASQPNKSSNGNCNYNLKVEYSNNLSKPATEVQIEKKTLEGKISTYLSKFGQILKPDSENIILASINSSTLEGRCNPLETFRSCSITINANDKVYTASTNKCLNQAQMITSDDFAECDAALSRLNFDVCGLEVKYQKKEVEFKEAYRIQDLNTFESNRELVNYKLKIENTFSSILNPEKLKFSIGIIKNNTKETKKTVDLSNSKDVDGSALIDAIKKMLSREKEYGNISNFNPQIAIDHAEPLDENFNNFFIKIKVSNKKYSTESAQKYFCFVYNAEGKEHKFIYSNEKNCIIQDLVSDENHYNGKPYFPNQFRRITAPTNYGVLQPIQSRKVYIQKFNFDEFKKAAFHDSEAYRAVKPGTGFVTENQAGPIDVIENSQGVPALDYARREGNDVFSGCDLLNTSGWLLCKWIVRIDNAKNYYDSVLVHSPSGKMITISDLDPAGERKWVMVSLNKRNSDEIRIKFEGYKMYWFSFLDLFKNGSAAKPKRELSFDKINTEYAIKKSRFEKKVTLNYMLDDDHFMGAQWGVQGTNTDVFIVKDTGENEILESTVVKTFYPNNPMGLLLRISDFKMRYLIYKTTFDGGFYQVMEKDLNGYADAALPGPLSLYPPERD